MVLPATGECLRVLRKRTWGEASNSSKSWGKLKTMRSASKASLTSPMLSHTSAPPAQWLASLSRTMSRPTVSKNSEK